MDFSPKERTLLLFDLVEEAIADPTKDRQAPSEEAEREERAIDKADLERAFSDYEEALDEQEELPPETARGPGVVSGPPTSVVPGRAAGLGRRLLSASVDIAFSLALGAAVYLLVFADQHLVDNLFAAFSGLKKAQDSTGGAFFPDLLYSLSSISCFALFFFFSTSIYSLAAHGRTLGQKVSGLRTRTKEYSYLDIKTATNRTFCQSTSIFSLGLTGLPFYGKDKTPLHDYLSETLVEIPAKD